MLVNGSAGASSNATSETVTRRNTNSVTTATAAALAFQEWMGSARSAATPPAPRPATNPVTASGATAEIGIPTSSDSTIARITAPGARGCSDRKARTTNTNGTSARPNAISGAGAGARGSSEPTATTPASTDQNAGAITSVASVM